GRHIRQRPDRPRDLPRRRRLRGLPRHSALTSWLDELGTFTVFQETGNVPISIPYNPRPSWTRPIIPATSSAGHTNVGNLPEHSRLVKASPTASCCRRRT